MNRSIISSSVVLTMVAGVLLAPTSLWGQRVPPPRRMPDYVMEVSPKDICAEVCQFSFDLDAGLAEFTDWGALRVDPSCWNQGTGMTGGYLNFFIQTRQPDEPIAWVVQNLLIPKAIASPCPEDGSDGSAKATPQSTYFDLRPDMEGSTRLGSITGVLFASEEPLLTLRDMLILAGNQPSFSSLPVVQKTVNAEGAKGEREQDPRPQGKNPLLVGHAPVLPDPWKEPPLDLAYPIECFQATSPNVQCARNQCVPMAHALVLGYLESRYNGNSLIWNLPQLMIPGIGQIQTFGDVVGWIPVPDNSVVAQVDARTWRNGVFNPDSGSGSTRCQGIRGAFGYMGEESMAQITYRHQGGDPSYGDGDLCDNGLFNMGGIVSTRQGQQPTWKWIFDQLCLGRGVGMTFGRYDNAGERTSGHMVRVWGAARYNNRNYLYTLDDGNQGSNNSGLRTEQWEVADTGAPGNPNGADGLMNMNGTTWEIEFAISAEAKPFPAIP